nr:sialidase family protein [Mesorhizobium liriopis]
MAAELSDWSSAALTLAKRYPWARSGGETWVHRSEDHGATFTQSVRIDTAPFSGGYGMRGAIEIDGAIVLPLSDVPHYAKVFVVRSTDGGLTWSMPIMVAAGQGHEFEEPAPLLAADGAILMLLRDNVSRDLHSVRSTDGGHSWSDPTATGIADYPAHLVRLDKGRIAAVTGRRREPFGIALYLSEDAGVTWNATTPLVVRSDLPNRDLGYPTAALRADGSLFVAYYAQASGITGLHATVVPQSALVSVPRTH